MEDKRVRVRVPKDPQNPEVKTTLVVINGYPYEIELGKDVYVPEEVYRILDESGKLG